VAIYLAGIINIYRRKHHENEGRRQHANNIDVIEGFMDGGPRRMIAGRKIKIIGEVNP
jgi:hypothetical protein